MEDTVETVMCLILFIIVGKLAIEFWQITLMVVATLLALWFCYWLCKHIYKRRRELKRLRQEREEIVRKRQEARWLTPCGLRQECEEIDRILQQESLAEIRRQAEAKHKCEEAERKREEEERNRENERRRERIREKDELAKKLLSRKGVMERFSEEMVARNVALSLQKFADSIIIVDTNIFMDSGKDANDVSCDDGHLLIKQRNNRLLAAIERMKLKIHILPSQLNELANILRNDNDKGKLYRARVAQREIEELQNKGVMVLLGDVNAKEAYADPEILKTAQRLVAKGDKALVITRDRNLRIKLNFAGAICKSPDEVCGLSDKGISVRGVHCGGMYVSVDEDCGLSLIANKDRADLGEKFSLMSDEEFYCFFLSKATGRYVCVDEGHDGRLAAQGYEQSQLSGLLRTVRTRRLMAQGAKFELVPVCDSELKYALKSLATGKYVSVCEDKGNALFANASEIGDCEIFEFC